MGLRDSISSLWSREDATRASNTVVSLADLDDRYRLLEVVDEPGMQYAIVTEKFADVDLRELGSSSPSPWTSTARAEYNPELAGLRGYEKYDRMRKSDGTIRGTLRAIKTPVLSGRWFMQPASNSDQDKKISEHIWWNLTKGMSIGWTQVLQEALLCADFGNYMFEKVWDNIERHGEMYTCLTKLAPRHPMDVQSWVFDAHGGPLYVKMNPASSAVTTINGETFTKIDIDKLLVFTFDREAGNIEGTSVLRTAYKHWYYMEQLYKIDAIQKERHGIGIPMIKLPVGFKDTDKKLAQEIGRNIRTNEQAHIVLPPGWEIMMLKLEGQPVDALKSVEIHQTAIREQLLVNFVIEGAKEDDLVMFMKASRIMADIICETINMYLIPQMVRLNWPDVEDLPTLKVRRIGESADWRTLSFAIRNLIGSGVIIPDDALEENLREEMDLPARDPETARMIQTPQNPYDMDNPDAEDDDALAKDDPGTGDGSDTTGNNTHNQNNPAYNRAQKARQKRRHGLQGKQKNGIAGLPRQKPATGPFGQPRQSQERSGG